MFQELGYAIGPQDYSGMLQQQIIDAESFGLAGFGAASPLKNKKALIVMGLMGLTAAYYDKLGLKIPSEFDFLKYRMIKNKHLKRLAHGVTGVAVAALGIKTMQALGSNIYS